MKAIVYESYGSPDVLHLSEVEKPVLGPDQVLVKICASSINSRDWRMMRADPFIIRFMVGGLFKPKNPILGVDVAGTVEALGSQVTQFRAGDEVFGCVSLKSGGTFAEYTCAGVNEIVLKPANITFEQAASVPLAALTALQALRDSGNIQAGQKVLIQGASGGVGSFAVQIAKALGAEVTGVCSTRNLEMLRAIGADHSIDYQKEDFTRNGQRYDLILAANGYHPIGDYLRALTPQGRYVVAGGAMFQLFQAALWGKLASKPGGQKIAVCSLVPSLKDLLYMKELLESGQVVPVIDDCYPLEKTADAFRYYEKTHARGKVVITMGKK